MPEGRLQRTRDNYNSPSDIEPLTKPDTDVKLETSKIEKGSSVFPTMSDDNLVIARFLLRMFKLDENSFSDVKTVLSIMEKVENNYGESK